MNAAHVSWSIPAVHVDESRHVVEVPFADRVHDRLART